VFRLTDVGPLEARFTRFRSAAAQRMPLAPLIVLRMGLSGLHVHPLKGALHHVQWLYPRTVLPLEMVENSTGPFQAHFGAGFW
jgi:hypothetical protein